MRSSTRTIGGTVLLALLLVTAGCSGGGDTTPVQPATEAGSPTPGTTQTPAETTDTGTPGTDTGASATADAPDRYGGPNGDLYLFRDGEAYGYVANDGNRTITLSWEVTDTAGDTQNYYQQTSVNVSVGGVGNTSARTAQADVFAEVIARDALGGPFLFVRTPAVLARGQNLSVGHSWRIDGSNVSVGDGIGVRWDTATAEITGTATVANESCYTMDLRLGGNETGPTSCVKEDWPFALAVDTESQEYRLVEFQRP